jgi:Ferric reductase NAD binding domain
LRHLTFILKFWNDNQPDKLQVRFYLTGMKVQSITENGDDDEESMETPEEMFGQQCDFVMSRIYTGRPNWKFLFNYWTSLYSKETMNIYSCGPKALNKEVHKMCRSYNKKGFRFKFLHEAFSS